MRYVNAVREHLGQGRWQGYVPEFGLQVFESSLPRLEYETFRRVEENEGLHSFTIVWRDA